MKRNKYAFGLGTIGRDMVYSMVSMYLTYYLTDIIEVSTSVLWWITGIMLAARVFDALNDPVMGVIVDNTDTRWGKFKPWIAFGALTSGVLTILLYMISDWKGPRIPQFLPCSMSPGGSPIRPMTFPTGP